MDLTFWLTYIILWGVVILQSVIIFNYMKFTNNFIHKITKLESVTFQKNIEKGSKAPPFVVKDQFKKNFKIEPNQSEEKSLIFISESCPTCKRIINSITPSTQFDKTNTIFISNGDLEAKYKTILIENNVRFTINNDLFQKYNVYNSPLLIKITPTGLIQNSTIIDSIQDLTNLHSSYKVI
ncbi:hypothetical protein B0G93_11551 [Bacillus sp. V-88]|jgi:hypothetical protein|uniref:Uncharacterized protein n=1 Tax=Rossellomorea vietnamensis TaxID=218284 RepID=A0A6I6UUF7_9BACI|nr:hypothetical protein [Rossellomorea vietnamensis]OXS58165.1 hypothetical protein B1B00_14545 [Bacillus sp. DSM 27956]PRX75269.1 hypothetical protein B0G93_11551 [Bacillus sp. V-88]QHE62642.1 hypothetical protein FHE72_17630 [Rossellomorea vietnamensis]SLK23720.1 hypothetical protein SAMN06295884_11551 [Bacillus sp. V-88]